MRAPAPRTPLQEVAWPPGLRARTRSHWRAERTQHLHHEYCLVILLERSAQLADQRAEHIVVAAEHLRAHAVRHHLEARREVQPVDEVLDGRDELRVERIETDLDADIH